MGDEVGESVSVRADRELLARHVTDLGLHVLGDGELIEASQLGRAWSEFYFGAVAVAGGWRKNSRWACIGGRESCPRTVAINQEGEGQRWKSGGMDGGQEACGMHRTGKLTKVGEG